VQIVGFAGVRLSGTVTDDGNTQVQGLAGCEELQSAGESPGVTHTRAVSETLNYRPTIFFSSSPQMIADLDLVVREIGGNKPFFKGQLKENIVVANDGVIEVGPDMKKGHKKDLRNRS
jgi:hypothetical protein